MTSIHASSPPQSNKVANSGATIPRLNLNLENFAVGSDNNR